MPLGRNLAILAAKCARIVITCARIVTCSDTYWYLTLDLLTRITVGKFDRAACWVRGERWRTREANSEKWDLGDIHEIMRFYPFFKILACHAHVNLVSLFHISTLLDFTVSPLLPRSSSLSDLEHRQLSLYAKEKPDHFHVYDADKYSYLSNEAYYPTWILNHRHFSDNGMSISGNL